MAHSGQYLYFLDVDDWIEPDALRVMVDSVNLFGSDVAVARLMHLKTAAAVLGRSECLIWGRAQV